MIDTSFIATEKSGSCPRCGCPIYTEVMSSPPRVYRTCVCFGDIAADADKKKGEPIELCQECYSYNHKPGCPNAPEPELLGVCSECYLGINKHEADESYTIDGDLVCSECIKDYLERFRNTVTVE